MVLIIRLPVGRRFQFAIPPSIIGILALVVVGATLTAGLRPFHVPKNGVAWVPGRDAVRFGKHGTMLSTTPLQFPSSEGNSVTVELWMQPARVWSTGCILAILNQQDGRQFLIQQDYTDLVLSIEDRHQLNRSSLRVPEVFRRPQAFLTITSDEHDTAVYVDGQLEASSADFHLSRSDLSGRLILANPAFRDHSWSGSISGLAFYGTLFHPEQVRQAYSSWVLNGAPSSLPSQPAAALYVFREHSGDLVHSSVSSAPDLKIPDRFTVVDHLLFESPASEMQTQATYWSNALLNVGGFVPLGIVMNLYLSTRGVKHVGPLAVLAGTAVSLTIEFWQSFIPIRFSGVSDLVTNTIGTLIGVMLSGWLLRYATPAKRAAARFRQ